MIKNRFFFAITLVLTILLSMFSQSFGLPETKSSMITELKDISKGYWGFEAISWMRSIGAINGYTDGTFRPDESLTKAQFSQILYKSVPQEVYGSTEIDFADVSKEHWAFEGIKLSKNFIEWDTEDGKNLFKPDKLASRESVAVAMSKVFNLKTDFDENSILSKYEDESSISPENRKAVAAVIKYKIMTGYKSDAEKLSFKPKSNITRVQIVQLLYNAVVKNKIGSFASTYETEDNYVGKISDEIVTQSEFYYLLRLQKLVSERNNAGKSEPVDFEQFWQSADGEKEKNEVMKRTISDLKLIKTALKNAKNEKIEMTTEEIENIMKSVNQNIVYSGGEKAFAQRIAKAIGINLEQFKKIQLEVSLFKKYMAHKEETISVSDEELKKYYDENKANFDSATVVHVLFLTQGAENTETSAQGNETPSEEIIAKSQEKETKAKKNAEDVLARINKGEDIKAIAKELSEDPGVVDNGGEYVVKRNGQMVKEFEDFAIDKNVGDTGIVKTSYGYHVMKKIKLSTQEEAMKEAITVLRRDKVVEMGNKWVADPLITFEKNQTVFDTIVF